MSLSRYSALVSAALLAACAATSPQPDGRWKSVDSDGNPPLEVELKSGRLVVSGGCNRLFGTARVENGKLIVDQLATTMMACDPVSMARDRELSALFNSHPPVRRQGDRLLLGEPGKQLVLRPQDD